MIKIIDPHLHLFDLQKGDYTWLKPEKPPFWPDKHLINKSFTENDLTLNDPLSLAGYVHIEAGFDNQHPHRELKYLQADCQLPFSSIANIDLTLDSILFNQQLKILSGYQSFIGVRHIFDESAFDLLNNNQVLTNFTCLNNFAIEAQLPLVFEVQFPFNDTHSVVLLCNVIAKNQHITFIINHAGFPTTKVGSTESKSWLSNLMKLEGFENIVIKCSGWEMVDRKYKHQQDWLNDTLQNCFTTFGEKRMMLASNFPLCLFSNSTYQQYWHELLNTDFMQSKSEQEKSALCYHNALRYYRLTI
jgi:predicted TIM-barrel fold metal-dependent hydrolase